MSQSPDHRWPIRAGLLLLMWEIVTIDQIAPALLPVWLRAALLFALLVTASLALARWWNISRPARYAAASLVDLCAWHALVAGAGWWHLGTLQHVLGQYGAAGLFLIGLMWIVWFAERESRRYECRCGEQPCQKRRAKSRQQ